MMSVVTTVGPNISVHHHPGPGGSGQCILQVLLVSPPPLLNMSSQGSDLNKLNHKIIRSGS